MLEIPKKVKDLIGQRFGHLLVIEYLGIELVGKKSFRSTSSWLCQCDCGNLKKTNQKLLSTDRVKSCGCLWGYHLKKKNELLFPDGLSAKFRVISIYKASAKKRNLNWNLSQEEAFTLFESNCFYCGTPPLNICKNRVAQFIYTGIDRVNNLGSYSFENCVPCCKTCNIAKRALSAEDWQIWLNRIIEFQLKKRSDNGK